MKKTNSYIEKGICIWCKLSEPNITFHTEPHIAPKALGCTQIGFDICDSCNHYFGTANNSEPNTNLIFSEVFKSIRLFSTTRDENSWRNYKSAYFEYRYKDNSIRLKKTFNSRIMTKQFKRAIYEVFLQNYHKETMFGLDTQFDHVRNYARFAQEIYRFIIYIMLSF